MLEYIPEDPANREEAYPCGCGGEITRNADSTETGILWQCNTCLFVQGTEYVPTTEERTAVNHWLLPENNLERTMTKEPEEKN